MDLFKKSILFFVIACMSAGCGNGGDGTVPLITSDTVDVSSTKAWLTFDVIRGANSAENLITSDLNLITSAAIDIIISWVSNDPSHIATDGTVTRPPNTSGNVSVILTATISKGGAKETKVFKFVVLANPLVNEFVYSGIGYGIDHVDTPRSDSSDVEITYILELGGAVRDVYYIFTNVGQSDATNSPLVAQLVESLPQQEYADEKERSRQLSDWARQQGVAVRGRPDVSLFNSNPQLFSGSAFRLSRSVSFFPTAPQNPLADIVNDTQDFFPDINSTTISATCRKVVSDGVKTLNVWVADDAWFNGCSRANCINQTMVDALAEKFLKVSSNNDIYDWLTNIYGVEWGAHPFSNLIQPDNNITILLMDIDNDNATSGGVGGFFWAKDNYKLDTEDPYGFPYSNRRLMFYIDSVMFATPEGDTWELTDRWPQETIGTLAHEFQHMIHFYQKNVLQFPASSEAWINEMASEVAEDFVATKVAVNGPRGVSYNVGTAGSANNTKGRLPRFNRFNYVPVADWLGGIDGNIDNTGDDNVLNSYSVNYAFGAFLTRNFGGASLFQNLVQNNKSDYIAVETALSNVGFTGENFGSVLQKWGVAVLLSDDGSTTVPKGYRYNTGGFVPATINDITYNLGSINLFNYFFEPLHFAGPQIYQTLPPTDANAGKYKTSNMYYRLGTGLTGTIEKSIILRKGTKLTVVVR